jgi:AcrR family transcriptional regulator
MVSVRLTGEQRRQQLLSVASALLEEDGPSAITMERVSARAGVTKPVVYRHFANRSALVAAMLEESWQTLDTAIAKRVAAASGPAERIRASFAAFLDETARQGPGMRALVESVSDDPQIEAARKARWQVQEATWAKGFKESFGLAGATAAAAAAVLHGALAGAVNHAGQSKPARREAEDVFVTALFATLSALAARTGSATR